MTVVDRRVPFDVELVDVEGRTAVVEVRGDVDVASAPRLRDLLGTLAARGKSQVVVDLSRTDFVDSAGLQALLTAERRARSANGALVLVAGESSRLRRLLRVAGIDDVLRTYGGVDAARRAVLEPAAG